MKLACMITETSKLVRNVSSNAVAHVLPEDTQTRLIEALHLIADRSACHGILAHMDICPATVNVLSVSRPA